jgi:hypothetical protein
MNNELIKRIDYCLKYDELPTVARQTFQLCLAALLQAQPVASSQDKEKPVAWMFQHEETGITSTVDAQQVEWGFEKNNPRLQKVCALYAIPDTHRVASVPQDVEGFIVENELPAFGDDSKVFTFIRTATLRAWMAGHARVPVEPTYEDMQSMIDAGIKSTSAKVTRNECLMIYAAMLTRRCNLLTASKEGGQ